MSKYVTKHPRPKKKRIVKRSVLSALLYGSGIPVKDFATFVGVAPSCISAIANGDSKPSDELLQRIAVALDLQNSSPEHLLNSISSDNLTIGLRALLAVD